MRLQHNRAEASVFQAGYRLFPGLWPHVERYEHHAATVRDSGRNRPNIRMTQRASNAKPYPVRRTKTNPKGSESKSIRSARRVSRLSINYFRLAKKIYCTTKDKNKLPNGL
jgi:hypothetical protein